MFKHHLTSGALTMVNVDEAHLFCQFGLFFRDEFLLLKKHMFDKLKVPQRSYLKVPVLFMTATANMAILKRLSGITGLTFKPQHVYWPPAPSMYDPRANIEVQYTDQPIRSLRRYFDLLQIGQAGVPKRQFLIVANSRAKIERTHADVQQYIDSQSHIQGDVLLIVGTMYREQKDYYTNLFINPTVYDNLVMSSAPAGMRFDLDNFCAIGALVTRSLGSCGWDDPHLHLVHSHDKVREIVRLRGVQEKVLSF